MQRLAHQKVLLDLCYFTVCHIVDPTDILEPPWSPSREPPPPRQLKVLGLVPPSASTSARGFPLTLQSHFKIAGSQSVGRLIPLTNKVYCRTVTQSAVGPLDATLPMLHRRQSTCPFQMREAPVESELNPPLGDVSNGGKILLTLQESASGMPVYTDALHAPPPPSRNSIQWSWRAWLGPTVRRWHFENFNIRLQSDRIRRISNFPVFDKFTNSCIWRYEQTKITVTARIFTTLPDTGERMYLSDILPGTMSSDDMSAREYDHLTHRPTELDVTHLLPSWSLRLRPFPSTSEFVTAPLKAPATIFRNKRSVYPFLIGRSEGHVRIELIAAPKDSQPLAYKDVSIVASEKNDFVRLKVECVSWMITLSGRLEPHPSAEILLRSSTDSYGTAVTKDGATRALLLPNEKEMIADFAAHPHPRVLNLIVRGQDPTDLHVITAQLNSGALQNISSSTQNVFCPLGKIALSLILEDGSEMGLHLLPEGQVRVSALLQSTKKAAVWDPAKPLLIAPVTEEGKALVAAGKIGHGPMINAKSIALWPGQPLCAPKSSLFLPDTRPLVAISVGPQNDPGVPDQSFDWEQEAIQNFRRNTGPTSIGSFEYGRSHFLVPRDFQVTELYNTYTQPSPLFTTQIKYILFGIIIFSVIFLTIGCLALIIVRHRKNVRRRKARIEEDPNGPDAADDGGKAVDDIYPISPQLSLATAATAATMNPGLSCSSVFSGNSGGPCTPAQTAELINQWTGRQPTPLIPPPQCGSCSNSVGTRSLNSDAVHNDLRTGGMVEMRTALRIDSINITLQVANPTLKLDSSQRGLMSPASPNFSSKWQTPESLGSAPSSRNTGSPSTNDEGFASGPLDLQSKRHIYCNTSSRVDHGTWGLGMSETLPPLYSCQTSHHSPDPLRGSTCANTCYLPGEYMGTSIAADSKQFYGGPSEMPSDSMPPRLTLAHDPESIGFGKYTSKLNQLPPSLLLPTEMLKMETSQTAGAGYIGDTTEEKLLMDSGRESQDKTSSSGASSGMNKDFSSLSGIEITQVDV
ncbi:hypothetical protein ECG_02550 [Echinococcus granulosus]|nr:hypothetical protein ECG_02550 [Echinococcus granulosus]